MQRNEWSSNISKAVDDNIADFTNNSTRQNIPIQTNVQCIQTHNRPTPTCTLKKGRQQGYHHHAPGGGSPMPLIIHSTPSVVTPSTLLPFCAPALLSFCHHCVSLPSPFSLPHPPIRSTIFFLSSTFSHLPPASLRR